MTRLLTGCAALALLFAISLPGPAGAAARRPDGIRGGEQAEAITDVSAHRRRYRHHHRYYGSRYWGPGPYWGYYRPWPYYRPYPGAYIGVGPFGFGVW